MAASSSLTLESLDLGDTLVGEDEALETFKQVAAKSGLDEKVAVFLVKTAGVRVLDDLELISDESVDKEIIPNVSQLGTPLV